jgi:predicted transcriptional regulator
MVQSTIRRRPPNTTRNARGDTADRIDRRNKVLALRARGLSFREIGRHLDIDHAVAWRDYITVADDPDFIPTADLAKEQLLAAHAELIGKLMADLDQQAAAGQVEELRNGDGELVNAKVKRWISPQTAAEAGRALQRVAVLMGLTEVNPDQAAAATSTTSITLISPGSAAEFGQRAQQLAEARQSAPEAIDVAVVHPQPEAPQEPAPAPPMGWREARAARKAQEGAVAAPEAGQGNGSTRPSRRAQGGTQQPAVRFLPAPQRN